MFLARITANSEIETIIFLVGADPKPGDHIAVAQTKRSITLFGYEQHKHRYGVLRNAAKGDRGRASKAHTFRALVSAQTPAGLRSISRSADPPCRSRQFLKPANADILAHFLENRSQPPILIKVSVNLPVPFNVLTLANE